MLGPPSLERTFAKTFLRNVPITVVSFPAGYVRRQYEGDLPTHIGKSRYLFVRFCT